MEKRKIQKLRIIIIVIVSMAATLFVLYLVPFLHPIKVFYDPFCGYGYTVFKDYVSVDDHYHVHIREEQMPDYLWGRPVEVINGGCFTEPEFVIMSNSSYYNWRATYPKKIVLSEHTEIIGEAAFRYSPYLKEVVGGTCVKVVESYAFDGCEKLQQVELGNSLEYVGKSAFYCCINLEGFSFGENITYIGDYAFAWTKINQLPENMELEYLGDYAFKGTAIAEVPEELHAEYIGTGVFSNTPWLEAQTEEYVILDGVLLQYNGDDEVVMVPEGIRGIAGAFGDNENIKEIYVSEGTEYISDYSFPDIEGVKIYIPGSVTDFYGKIGGTWQERITIVTMAGTAAQQYAIDNDIPYEIVEEW